MVLCNPSEIYELAQQSISHRIRQPVGDERNNDEHQQDAGDEGRARHESVATASVHHLRDGEDDEAQDERSRNSSNNAVVHPQPAEAGRECERDSRSDEQPVAFLVVVMNVFLNSVQKVH